MRNDERHGDRQAPPGIGQTLAVVAARGAYQARAAGLPAPVAIEIDQPTAHLEGADGRVILMLDPDLAAGALAQQRPGILRRRRHDVVDKPGRLLEFAKIEHAQWSPAGRPPRIITDGA